MKMIFYSHAKKLIFPKNGFALSLIFKVKVLELRNVLFNKDNKIIYYINANEIPGELSHKNLISSHVKISPLLWLHNKSRLSHQKTIKVKWFGISLVFIYPCVAM